MQPWRILEVALLSSLFSACTPIGLIYSNVTVPLDSNFDSTPVAAQRGRADAKTVQYRLRIDWGDISVGTIAAESGLERVYYADLRTLRILRFWTRRFLTIYGERAAR